MVSARLDSKEPNFFHYIRSLIVMEHILKKSISCAHRPPHISIYQFTILFRSVQVQAISTF